MSGSRTQPSDSAIELDTLSEESLCCALEKDTLSAA